MFAFADYSIFIMGRSNPFESKNYGRVMGETAPSNVASFDPAIFRFVLFNQRGNLKLTFSAGN